MGGTSGPSLPIQLTLSPFIPYSHSYGTGALRPCPQYFLSGEGITSGCVLPAARAGLLELALRDRDGATVFTARRRASAWREWGGLDMEGRGEAFSGITCQETGSRLMTSLQLPGANRNWAGLDRKLVSGNGSGRQGIGSAPMTSLLRL